jgi:hypothetical protein
MNRPIPPKSVVKLVKLWPHARRHGYEVGQSWRVGYYIHNDGLDVIWLVDEDGNYCETVDHDWLEKHFEIVILSTEESLYGHGKTPL